MARRNYAAAALTIMKVQGLRMGAREGNKKAKARKNACRRKGRGREDY